MNITQRTCANCAAFNPSATDDEVVCGNLVSFTEHHGTPKAVNREPSAADCCDSHQTHEEDAAETLEIEMARHLAQATPEFMNASRACLALRDSLGEEHPETQKALELAMSLAPPSLMEQLATQKAAAKRTRPKLGRPVPMFQVLIRSTALRDLGCCCFDFFFRYRVSPIAKMALVAFDGLEKAYDTVNQPTFNPIGHLFTFWTRVFIGIKRHITYFYKIRWCFR